MSYRALRVAIVIKGSPTPAIKTAGNAVIGDKWYIVGRNSGGNVTSSPKHTHRAPIAIAVKWETILFCRSIPTLKLPMHIPTETRVRTAPPYEIDLLNCSFRNGVTETW